MSAPARQQAESGGVRDSAPRTVESGHCSPTASSLSDRLSEAADLTAELQRTYRRELAARERDHNEMVERFT